MYESQREEIRLGGNVNNMSTATVLRYCYLATYLVVDTDFITTTTAVLL